MMRTVLAALFIIVGMLVEVSLFSHFYGDRFPRWAGPAIGSSLLVWVAIAFKLFSGTGVRTLGRSAEQILADLEAKGLLVDQTFKARRAFEVEEFEDEGKLYFIELDNGSVLFLAGQYLYDYAPIDDDPEENQPRKFPCAEFTIRRHKTEHYVVEIKCAGKVLEPEICAPPFNPKKFDDIPGDGDIITDQPYESLKAKSLGRGRKR